MAKALQKGGSLNVRPFPMTLHWRCIELAAKKKTNLRLFVIEALNEKIKRIDEEEKKKPKSQK